MRRRFRYIAVAMAVAFLPAGQPAWGGMVLCVGEDGHIAYETALDGDCYHVEASPVRSDAPQFGLEPSADPCGDCRDIPLTLQAPVRGVQRDARPPGHAAHTVLARVCGGLSVAHGPRTAAAGPDIRPDGAGAQLATIVIQI